MRLRLIVDLGTRHCTAVIGGRFLKSAEGKQLLEGAKQQQIGTGTGGVVMGHDVNISALEVGSHSYSNVKVALTIIRPRLPSNRSSRRLPAVHSYLFMIKTVSRDYQPRSR